MSGCRFFWVVKTAKVDREEKAVEIEELLGEGYVKRVEERGLVVRQWVEQDVVLVHRAVAGFLSHSGSNSVMEAAAAGLKMLAWPRGGDHRVIAASVPRNGLGIWPENWAWEAEERVVAAEEIAVKVREFMADEKLAETAAKLGAAATA
ncbi:UDP-glucose:2-hydroxyflavanone C-glucosyltransferase-like, partial [Dendrobium catenatum]|uniref:UDP-glucose:2-hydroxyflavanone C-glucosyltransferase-like n=1 Tax=Dendrobium catenatum TaxID=906689 RepID=UPI00109FEF7D